MILYKYIKILNLKIMHGFYSSFYTSDLELEPTPECSLLLKNLGIVFKKHKYGLSLFGDVAQGITLLKGIPDDARFSFLIKLKNRHFHNFSNIPFPGKEQFFYFNNKSANADGVFGQPGNKLLLTNNNYVGRQDLMKKVTGTYNFPLPGNGSSKTAKLSFIDLGVTYQETADSVDGFYHFQFDMKNAPSGRCKLTIDASVVAVDNFYYLNEVHMGSTFGIVELFATAAAENTFVTNGNQPDYKDFKIAFEKRSTIWRYKITNTLNVSFPDAGILAPSPHVFNKINDDLYISQSAVPMLESGIASIEFRKDVADDTTTLFENLPNAGIEQIIPDQSDPNKIYSDIFIYI